MTNEQWELNRAPKRRRSSMTVRIADALQDAGITCDLVILDVSDPRVWHIINPRPSKDD